jgi:hypothetical protein
MASQILITMDDLETAVRLNAALEAAREPRRGARWAGRAGIFVDQAVELVRGMKMGHDGEQKVEKARSKK